jgi:hypothetical protein
MEFQKYIWFLWPGILCYQGPMLQKFLLPLFTNFHNELRVFVRGKVFKPNLTITQAYYVNSQITD